MASETLRRQDWGLLVVYCGLLFGVSLVGGRPMTLHEAVLPQSSREMLADGDWIVPKKGGEPWLESPPLPQWCTVAIASGFGRCDAEWIVRLGPLLVGAFCVCLTAWMASVWYGRTIGLLSGLILATTCEFTRYAWLAEDEIYLCGLVTAAVAWFVKLEFAGNPSLVIGHWSLGKSGAGRPDGSGLPLMTNDQGLRILRLLFGPRSLSVIIFFVLLGATNLAKGLIFGTAMAAIPMAGWLAWNRDWPRIRNYLWVWGAVLFTTIMFAWPLAARLRSPDVVAVWLYDLGGRMSGEYTEINQPLWYYPVNLLWMLAPWTLVLPFGLAATWPAVKSERNSPARFLWAWAFLVPAVFSIPGGKHHHYLLHALTPWAILAAVGAERCRAWLATWPRWLVHPMTGLFTVGVPISLALAVLQARQILPGPPELFYGLVAAVPLLAMVITWGLHHPRPRTAAVTVFGALFAFYAAGHWYAGQYVDVNRFDVAFLKSTRRVAEDRQTPLVVDMNQLPLSAFLQLFYLPDNVRTVHNVSFLADATVPSEVLVLTRAGELEALREYGDVVELQRSDRPLKAPQEEWRMVLCFVRLHDGLARRSTTGIRITPMQAMHREDGPILK